MQGPGCLRLDAAAGSASARCCALSWLAAPLGVLGASGLACFRYAASGLAC